jgi:protein-disulfide isomerase
MLAAMSRRAGRVTMKGVGKMKPSRTIVRMSVAVALFTMLGGMASAKLARVPVAEAINWTRVVQPTSEGGMRMGNPKAPMKLVEYGSRTCPHCARFDAEGVPELEKGPIARGVLSYEFRDFPVHGAADLAPILLGNCVGTARFFPMLSAMFQHQATFLAKADAAASSVRVIPNPTPNQVAAVYADQMGYMTFVKQRGMSTLRARTCLANRSAVALLVKMANDADRIYGVAGTPTFLINGKKVENVYSWTDLRPVLLALGALI